MTGACAKNISGCPWVGHTNASRIFDSYIWTVGRKFSCPDGTTSRNPRPSDAVLCPSHDALPPPSDGATLNFNCPAERTGRMNESLAAVMHVAGAALNATFRAPPLAGVANASTPCGTPVEFALPDAGGQPFDYVVTMEDLTFGQRIANYTIEYQAVGSSDWAILVPPVIKNATGFADRPDGKDPRDQYVGHKRIDFPIVATGAGAGASVKVAKVRFNCLRSLEDPIYLRAFEVRERQVPWEVEWRGGAVN